MLPTSHSLPKIQRALIPQVEGDGCFTPSVHCSIPSCTSGRHLTDAHRTVRLPSHAASGRDAMPVVSREKVLRSSSSTSAGHRASLFNRKPSAIATDYTSLSNNPIARREVVKRSSPPLIVPCLLVSALPAYPKTPEGWSSTGRRRNEGERRRERRL